MFEPPPNHFQCSHCKGWVPLCEECIDDWPMGVASYCCRESHLSACERGQLHPDWQKVIVYEPKKEKK